LDTQGTSNQNALAKHALGIDHLAIAVRDLERSVDWFTTVLGFSVSERRTTEGQKTGMISAVMKGGGLTVVLLQGTNPESQVSQFVEHYGPGVQHVAIRVADAAAAVRDLEASGLQFDTPVIGDADLKQAFSQRDQNSGLMLEIIERVTEGFAQQNVSELFRTLENKGAF
jgi:methylmalonyl-CoA/ethylmalonyl-CoA epimerase